MFTVIEKEYIGTDYFIDKYRIVVSGKWTYNEKNQDEIINACTLCHFGGRIEKYLFDGKNTTIFVKIYID